MSRYQKLFQKLKEKNEGAFVPFMTIGDPNLEESFNIISAMVDGGADALELGIPFSDPSADGVVIQRSDKRALDAGTNTPKAFEIIKRIRDKYPDTPIGLLMYINLVYAPGINNFFKMCKDNGVDSVLIPDVPLPMLDVMPVWKEEAKKNNIELVLIAPPNANDETLKEIAKTCQGYVYLVSRTGVTGTEVKAQKPIHHSLDILRANDAPPALLGFGISTPEMVKEAIDNGADGAISGSALVKIVEANMHDSKKLYAEVKSFVASMKAATKK